MNKKLTALTATTTPVDADLQYVVTDAGTTPVSKKVTWANIKATLKTYFDSIYAPVLGADDNYVTDAEKIVIGNTSGTNTGDQDLTGLLKLDQTTPQTIINGQPIQNTLTASEIVATDANKKLSSLAVATYPSLTELSYVKGLSSSAQTQITSLQQASFYAGTMTVNAGTLDTGVVGDLQAVGGTDVNISEAAGADPLTVTFDFTSVTKLSAFAFYGYYAGGSGHQINVEIYNVGTTAWDIIGVIGSETAKRWYDFPIFNTTAYINAGAVSVRLRHIQTGINTHDLILDYLELNFGSTGGAANVSAASVTFMPSGDLSATNVGSALIELDTEKVAKATYDAHTVLYATTDNTPVALTVGEQTVIGRATGGNISALAIDSDLSSVSGSDDTIPSAKATKAALDLKAPLISPAFTTPNLGTPSAGTLTNCTGLPVDGIVDDTTSALGVGTIELGHASDTTLSRSGAGVLAVEGVVIPSISSTSTLTNKRINPRLVTATSYTTDTGTSLDVSTCDQFEVTAQAGALKFNNPSGTPVGGQKLLIRIKDNGTGRALTYDTQFRAIGVTAPTTTVANKTTYIGCVFNATDTKWDILAVGQEA